MLLNNPLTRGESKKHTQESERIIKNYLERQQEKLTILMTRFNRPNQLLVPRADSFFIILSIVTAILIDKFLLNGARNYNYLIYALLFFCLLWAGLKNMRMLKLSLQTHKGAITLRRLDKKIRANLKEEKAKA
jgi:hypothetical protein